jgi:hypothetical protein
VTEVAYRFVLLAEDRINARTAAVLVDRVIEESDATPEWLRELWAAEQREHTRAWTHASGDLGERFDRGTYSKLDHINAFCPGARALRRGVGAKAATVSKAMLCVQLCEPDDSAAAAVIALDADEDPEDAAAMRRAFEAQRAQLEADGVRCALLLALAQPESEAWCVAAVDEHADNSATIAALRRELGFDPIRQPHELTSTSKTAKRDCKRVFEALLGDRDSEAALSVVERAALEAWTSHDDSYGVRALAESVTTRLCPALARR